MNGGLGHHHGGARDQTSSFTDITTCVGLGRLGFIQATCLRGQGFCPPNGRAAIKARGSGPLGRRPTIGAAWVGPSHHIKTKPHLLAAAAVPVLELYHPAILDGGQFLI